MLWKYLTGLLFILVIIFSFLPKISGTLNDAYYYSQFDSTKYIPVKAKIFESNDLPVHGTEKSQNIIDNENNQGIAYFENNISADGLFNQSKIFYVRYLKSNKIFQIKKYENDPFFLNFPFIPGLEERARIILFHVPTAWISVLGFLVSMGFSIRYLRKKIIKDDEKAVISASLGLLFCLLATITGSIWAKFNWGSFWNWDPRETSIFILLIIYGSYFALRSAIEIEEKRATLSSIYSILAFITVPFFIFIMPRITTGLHPGSADDATNPGGGPLFKSGMSWEMRIIFFLSLIAFSLLFFWLFHIKVKVNELISNKIKDRE